MIWSGLRQSDDMMHTGFSTAIIGMSALARSMKNEAEACCPPPLFLGEVRRAAYRQVCAWRVGDHQVPRVEQDISDVALVMRAAFISRKKVARHSVMPESNECVSNCAAKFAGD
jgi:hypothetical protein